jgi:AcrR family transcriptional regulator
MAIITRTKNTAEKRRQADKNRRRCDIIDAARRMFFARGYTGATMDDIAEAAGLTKPTIYSYFKTKDELYYSITVPIIEKLKANQGAIQHKLETGGYASGSDIIRDHFRGYLELYAQDPEAFLLFMLLQQTGIFHRIKKNIAEKINRQVKERYEAIRRIYSRAIEQKLLQPVNVYHLVDTLWGTFQGIVLSTEMKFGSNSTVSDKGFRVLTETLEFAQQLIVRSLETSQSKTQRRP